MCYIPKRVAKKRTMPLVFKLIAGMLFFIIALCLLYVSEGQGATVYHVRGWYAGASEFDTVHNIYYSEETQALVKRDTIIGAEFNTIDTISLSDTVDYWLIQLWHEVGAGAGVYLTSSQHLSFMKNPQDSVRLYPAAITSAQFGTDAITEAVIAEDAENELGREASEAVDSLGISASVDSATIYHIAYLVDTNQSSIHGSGSWTTGGAGTGSYYDSLVFLSSDDSTVISLAKASVYTPGTSNLLATTEGGSDGIGSFISDADTVTVVVEATGYSFSATQIIVAGNQKDTIFGTPFDVSTPSGLNTCGLYGYIYDQNNNGITRGLIVATPGREYNDTCGDVISVQLPGFDGYRISGDNPGYFYLELPWASCTDSVPWRIEVWYPDKSGILLRTRNNVYIPSLSTSRLTWNE